MLPLMAQFTIRVELHRATGEDYSSLHSAMEYRGNTCPKKRQSRKGIGQRTVPENDYGRKS